MPTGPRHYIATAATKADLEEEVRRKEAEGWRRIGDPAMAVPRDPKRPPYWAQAMYWSSEEIPLQNIPERPRRERGGEI